MPARCGAITVTYRHIEALVTVGYDRLVAPNDPESASPPALTPAPDAWDCDEALEETLADLRRELADTTDPEKRAELERLIAQIE